MYWSLPEKGWDTFPKEKKDVKGFNGKDIAMQHTGCLNSNLKEEKWSDIVERKKQDKNLNKEGPIYETGFWELLNIYFTKYILLCIHVFL